MRYHYDVPEFDVPIYGKKYICDHPVYNMCTLYKIGDKGLAVIQQGYDKEKKVSWWGFVDDELIDRIYLHPNFKAYFDKHAGPRIKDIYPTVTVRQIMWALRMKPLKRERWETYFSRPQI